MTAEWPWVKLWVDDIDDPQWLAVADVAGSSPAVAFYSYAAGQAHANRYDRKGGSVAGLRPQVIASFCRVAADEVIRVFQAFRELGIWVGEHIANWAERQRGTIRLATVDGELVSDEGAEAEKDRRRRYVAAKVARHRARKRAAQEAEKRRVEDAAAGQEWLDIPVPWAEKSGEVTAQVTPVTPVTPVTDKPGKSPKTTESQRVDGKPPGGYIPQESESDSHHVSSTTESVAAREGEQCSRYSGGRKAPLREHVANASQSEDRQQPTPRQPNQAPGAGDPWLKARKRDRLVQKLYRYANARLSGAEHEMALNGLIGIDPERGEQWWVDHLDRRMRLEGWDDMAEWRTRNLAA